MKTRTVLPKSPSGYQLSSPISSLNQIIKKQLRSSSSQSIKFQANITSDFFNSTPKASKPMLSSFENQPLLISEDQVISSQKYSVLYNSNYGSPTNQPHRNFTASHNSRSYLSTTNKASPNSRSQAYQAIEERKQRYMTLNNTVGPWKFKSEERNKSPGNATSFIFSLASSPQNIKVPQTFIAKKNQRTEQLSNQIKSYQGSQIRLRQKNDTLQKALFNSAFLNKAPKDPKLGISLDERRSPKNLHLRDQKRSVPNIEDEQKLEQRKDYLELDTEEAKHLEQLDEITSLYKSLRIVYLVDHDEDLQLRKDIKGEIRPFVCENMVKKVNRLANMKSSKRLLKNSGREGDSRTTLRTKTKLSSSEKEL